MRRVAAPRPAAGGRAQPGPPAPRRRPLRDRPDLRAPARRARRRARLARRPALRARRAHRLAGRAAPGRPLHARPASPRRSAGACGSGSPPPPAPPPATATRRGRPGCVAGRGRRRLGRRDPPARAARRSTSAGRPPRWCSTCARCWPPARRAAVRGPAVGAGLDARPRAGGRRGRARGGPGRRGPRRRRAAGARRASCSTATRARRCRDGKVSLALRLQHRRPRAHPHRRRDRGRRGRRGPGPARALRARSCAREPGPRLGAAGFAGAQLAALVDAHPGLELGVITARGRRRPPPGRRGPGVPGDAAAGGLRPRGGRDRRPRRRLLPARRGRRRSSPTCWSAAPAWSTSRPTTGCATRPPTRSGTASTHPRPDLLAEAVYGLPERYRERIARRPARRQPGLLPRGRPPRPAAAGRRDRRRRHRRQERGQRGGQDPHRDRPLLVRHREREPRTRCSPTATRPRSSRSWASPCSSPPTWCRWTAG